MSSYVHLHDHILIELIEPYIINNKLYFNRITLQKFINCEY